DANVSVRPVGQKELGTRAELKNINSFKFVEKAINIEIERQIEVIEAGGKVVQETRLYDSVKNETRSMRSKEEANDYRYFPDPDLLPVMISDELKASIQADLPELPTAKKIRFQKQYGLETETAGNLTSSRSMADFYETVVKESACEIKLCTNWIIGDLAGALNKAGLDINNSPVNASYFSGLLKRIGDQTISGKIAKQVFDVMWKSAKTADEIIEEQGLKQITDTGAIEAIIEQIIADNPTQVAQYLSGKQKVFGFFVGQVMKQTQGKANPSEVNKMLKATLIPE
ncbi:MAG: Asp-tRNA(Asn)/Glu-tRNA(Gln) amidotransferase GatCAB subunit B, partial [Methylococcales bacterium]|nr:Asp-tRNA(Asn)/Glu-tRNA(Gln) amidotransferase GatCAB subunit B [Methylococcales bacterium]